jgi:outer membrane protein OmpA-like peptidoglycan-associated protein
MRKAMMTVATIAGTLTVLVGCATRDWVRDQLGPVSGGLSQQRQRALVLEQNITATAESVRDARTRAEAAYERSDAAHQRAESAYGRADAAHGRADAAYARADEVNGRLTRLWSNRHKRDNVENVDVYFGFDKADLDDAAETALASLAQELRNNPRLGVELQGYADPTGPVGYNVALSQRRVEAVRRFLVQKGIDVPRIHWIGLGPIVDGGIENAKKRRVTVRTMIEPE